MTTGERIKELRLKSHQSQTDFAADCGISKQLLYKYENSIITNIPTDKIEIFARKLGTTPAYLMGWTDDSYDWNKDPNHLIPTIPRAYMDACKGNAEQAWKAMQTATQNSPVPSSNTASCATEVHRLHRRRNETDDQSNNSLTDSSKTSEDPDIRCIEKARKKMNAQDREKMMKILRASFEEYFSVDFEDEDDDE